MTANGIDTDDLDVSIPGSGNIAAKGIAGAINVEISGSGESPRMRSPSNTTREQIVLALV